MKRAVGPSLFILISAFWAESSIAQNTKTAAEILKRFEKINSQDQCSLGDDLKYVCDSMTKLSCTPGTFDDGTGVALSDEEYQAKIDPMKRKATEIYTKNILEMLQDPDAKYDFIRTMAIKATKQANTPNCISEKKKEQEDCYKTVAGLLSSKSVNQMFSPMPKAGMGIAMGLPVDPGFDLAAYDALMENTAYKESLERARKKTLKIVSDDRLDQKIEKKIFPRVKELLISKIKSSISDVKTRDALISKIQNITYAGNDCASLVPGRPEENTVNGLMVENAYYSPKKQEFRFCNGYLLNNTSEFMIVKVIAHELSHSIDPGHIDQPKGVGFSYQQDAKSTLQDLENQFPFKGVAGCLRSKESIGARTINTYKAPSSTNPFAKKDQIGESFSDWMAAELLPEYMDQYHPRLTQNQRLTGYSNVFRTYCSEKRRSDFDVHPDVMDRIDRLLMANPEVRKQVGCSSKSKNVHYCKLGEEYRGTEPEALPTPTKDAEESDEHEGHYHE